MVRVLTPARRAALARQYIADFPAPLPALTKEEIRDGLLGTKLLSADVIRKMRDACR